MRMECADLDDIALRVGVVIPGPTPTLLRVVIWRCCISLLLKVLPRGHSNSTFAQICQLLDPPPPLFAFYIGKISS